MKTSGRLGTASAVAAMGLFGAACSSDLASRCVSACQHENSCLSDAGLSHPYPGTLCPELCSNSADAGYGGCTNPGALYDCISGLSCADMVGSFTSPGGPNSIQACNQKAGCPAPDGG